MSDVIFQRPCGGCKKRQEQLNKLLPYRKGTER